MKSGLPSIRTRLTRALLGWPVLWTLSVSRAVWLAVHDLMAAGGYKLYLNELTARQDRFKIICRYWQ